MKDNLLIVLQSLGIMWQERYEAHKQAMSAWRQTLSVPSDYSTMTLLLVLHMTSNNWIVHGDVSQQACHQSVHIYPQRVAKLHACMILHALFCTCGHACMNLQCTHDVLLHPACNVSLALHVCRCMYVPDNWHPAFKLCG